MLHVSKITLDVLPLDARSALGILARHITATLQVHLVARKLAAAIKLHRVGGIQLPTGFLGFGKGSRGSGVSGRGNGGGKQQAQQQLTARHRVVLNSRKTAKNACEIAVCAYSTFGNLPT